MTEPYPRSPANPAAPEVSIPPRIACGAGTEALVPVRIRHRGQAPAMMRITVLGLDARWAPEPIVVGPLAPGEATQITLILVPERGALGARYPFAVAVEASPETGAGTPLMGLAESTLTVDTQERIAMTIQPQTPVAVFGKKFRVEITNPGRVDRELGLSAESAHSASVHLSEKAVYVPAQHTVSVRGRVRVRRPTIIGHGNVHTFSVSARGQGAPEFAQASLRQRPLIRSGLTAVVALVAVVAVWVAAAIIFIPKISSAFTPKNPVAAPVTSTSTGPQASTGGAAGATSGSAGAESGGPGGPGGSGGSGGSGGPGGASNAGFQLAGTVSGPTPQGVTVSLQPTSLIEAHEAGASPAPNASPATGNALRSLSGALGKVPADAVRLTAAGATDSTATTSTAKDGTFSFGGITGPGYYLLTLSMAGFSTQRFLVNSVDLAGAKPMKIAMVPGQGKLSGTVTSGGVPIGAADVTLTDGTVSLQTSTVSTTASSGRPGTWTVDGLSTPGNYLVTVSAPGYGTESALVNLSAGGTEVKDINLRAGVASISGKVSGTNALGTTGGLGGISVTATDGKVTRTATTITTQPVGMYTLPNLTVPGKYTLTISGDGYQTQTQQVDLALGIGGATVNATLTRTDGVVAGTVTGTDVNGKSEGGLTGVGLTLTGDKVSFKTMTTSSPAGGFRFTGIPPGTYVLSASQYGRLTASATVELKAAQGAIENLNLQAAPNTELPATAHIRGQVVDSRTGGPLTCDRTATRISAAKCVVTVSVQAPVDPADPNKGTEVITATVGASEGFLYTLPALGDKAHPGLIPGLYRVTVSAPGYETSSTNVQVAQGQLAPAPQVSLPVLGIISGTITTRVGTPTAPSCVVAVPLSTTVTKPLPTNCTPAADGTTCTVPGLGQQPCGLTSTGKAGQGAFGTYQVRGLTHGNYQMLVIARDPEYTYVSQNPPIIQLDLGGDGQFDAVLDRLGRVQLTTFVANRQTGALTPASEATLTVTRLPSGTPHPAGKTLSDGTATITGLDGSYTVQAELGDDVISGPSGPVGLNQTVDVTLVIAAPVGPVVGRVTTDNGIDPAPTPVADATVTITGTVGYNGSSPISGTGHVITDAHGCYAILPAGWTAPAAQQLTSPDCPSPVVSKDSIATMASVISDGTSQPSALKTDRISVAVSAVGKLTQGYPVTSTVITDNQHPSDVVRVIPTVSVLPQPVNASPLAVTISGPTTGYEVPDLSTISIVVLAKPGLAGGVSITHQPTIPTTATAPVSANLTFSDTNLPSPSGMPGLYTLQVSLASFTTVQAYLLCSMGGTCSFVDSVSKKPLAGGLELKQYPSVSGSITVDKPLPGATLDWTKASVSQTAGPAGLPNVAVIASADPNIGTVVFGPSNQPSALALPGAVYQFAITLPGYGSQAVTVSCGTNYTDNAGAAAGTAASAVNGCTLLTPASGGLQQLPTFAGSLKFKQSDGSMVSISTASVAVTKQPNPSVTITAAPNASATPVAGAYPITWKDSSLPDNLIAAGSYTLAYSAPGFQSVTASFTCGTTSTCGPGQVTLNMLPQITGTITANDLPVGVLITDAVITPKTSPSTAGSMTVASDTSGALTFSDAGMPKPTDGPTNLAAPGPYTFTVALAGYATQTVAVVCGADYTANPSGGAGAAVTGCTPLNATMTKLPTFGGTLTLGTPAGPSTAVGTASVAITQQSNPSVTITTAIGSTPNADGSYPISWKDSSLPQNLVATGSYALTFSAPGFQSITIPFNCTATSGGCGPGAVTIKVLPQITGTITATANVSAAVITPKTYPTTAGSMSVAVDGTGKVWFTDSSKPANPPGLASPGTYTFSVVLSGYTTQTVTVVCGEDYTDNAGAGAGAVNGCTPLEATLTSLPTFSAPPGTLTLSAPTSPYGDRTFSTGSVSAQVSPNPGGLINVSVGTDGSLSWVDSSAGVLPGQIVPSSYTITFALPGFQPLTVPVACATTSCSIGAQTLQMLPQGKGTVTIPLPPNPSQLDLSKAVITTTAGHASSTSGLRLTLSQASATSTVMTANLIWTDSLQPFAGIIQPDTYTVTIALPGYKTSAPVQVTCTYGGTCAPTIAMTLSPSFNAMLTITPATLTTAALAVTGGPTDAGKVTLTADSTGDLTWQQVGSPTNVVTPGSTPYTINATLPGYELVGNTSFSCTTTSCVFPSLTLTAPTSLAVKFVDAADASTVSTVSATLYKAGTKVGQVQTSAGTATFTQQSTTTTAYTLDAHGAGYAWADGLSNTSATVSCTNSAQTAAGLTLIPGGTTVCTVRLAKLGTIVAQTNATMESVAGPPPVIDQLGSVAVTAAFLCATASGTCPATPDSKAKKFTGISDSSGALVLTGAVDNEGIKAGIYYVTATLAGYTPVSGTVAIAADASDVYSMGPSGLTDALPIDATNSIGPALQLDLAPKQLALQLHLTSGGSDILPPGVVTVTDSAGDHTCTIAASGAQPACVVSSGSEKYLKFADLYPGSLQLQVTPNPANYAPINKTVVVAAVTTQALATQTATVPLSPFSGTLNGAVVVDASNAKIGGATVALWPWQGSAPANDFGGHALTTKSASSDGTFTLSNIKPGSYELAVDATGYARWISGIIVVVANSPITDQTARLGVRSTRSVTLTLSSTATPAPDLTGAIVQLVQTSPLAPGATADPPLTLPAVTKTGASYTTQYSQVPTGTWTAQLISLTGMSFLANGTDPTYASAPFDVTDPTTGDASPPVIAAGFILNQSAAQLSATWGATDCSLAPTNVQFTVTPPDAFGSAEDIPATISGSTAKATVYVPKSPGTGDYSWIPKLSDATVWTAQSKTFTGKAAGTESSSSALLPVKVPVTVEAKIDGTDSPTLAAAATAKPATGPSVSALTGVTPTTFCLPPGTGWTFSVKNASATPPVLLDNQTGVTVHRSPTGTQNKISFAGYTLAPAVNLETVTGRSDTTSRTFSLSIAKDGTPAWWTSSADVTVNDSSSAAGGPALIVPKASYKVTASRTSPATDVFADVATSAALDPSSTPTAPDTLTATDKYAASILAVTVAGGPAGAASGATVTLADGGTPVTGVPTDHTGAVTTYYDLTPNKTYTATVTWTDTTTSDIYVGATTVDAGAGGSTPVAATVTLAKAPAVAVRVLDDDDQPVAGASVSLFDGSAPFAQVGAAAITDADGVAVFGALTASTDYLAIATYTKSSKTYSSGVQPVTTDDASSLKQLSLTPLATASVKVTVSWNDAGTAKPANGATVTLTQQGIQLFTETLGGSANTVTIPRLAPSQGVDISATWSHAGKTYTGTTSANTNASASTKNVTITVTPPP